MRGVPMKTSLCFTLAMAAGVFALASCASQPTARKVPVSASVQPKNPISDRIYQDVNGYRASRGASQLRRHAGLDRLAQAHSQYLLEKRGTFGLHGSNVSHMGFEGRALVAREHYQMSAVSENVAAVNGRSENEASQALLKLWKGSPEHHENMVDDWQFTGIGTAVAEDGTVFSTQLFANEGVGRMLTRTRFTSF